MPIVEVSCCAGGMSVKRLFCCHKPSNDTDDENPVVEEKKETVLYNDAEEQITILSTPHDLNLPLFIDFRHETEIATVVAGPDNSVVLAGISNPSLFRPRRDSVDEKNQEIINRSLHETMAPFLWSFMEPILINTLQGDWLQVAVLWRGAAHLIRTFPILDYRQKTIVAATVTIAPFQNGFLGNIQNFALNRKQKRYSSLRKKGSGVVGHTKAASSYGQSVSETGVV